MKNLFCAWPRILYDLINLDVHTKNKSPGKTKLIILSLKAAIIPKIKVRSSIIIDNITIIDKYIKLTE